MIKSFKHKGIKQFFETGNTKGIQRVHAQRISDILDLLNSAIDPKDLNFPGSYLHPLKGKFKGYWSVKISGNWRIIFRFAGRDAFDVNYLDYH